MLLIDNSAFARLSNQDVPQSRRDQISDMALRRELATSLPFLLEAGYSATSAADHNRILTALEQLPRLSITERVEDLGTDAQRILAQHGHHRVAPVDLIIAAIAVENGCGVLHYDKHYDLLRDKAGLRFESVWLAPRGSLD